MKIVEYNHTYAQKVAEMWNKSSSNWGNDEIFRTAQDVMDSESSSGNIKLYIALDDDKVVGYCSFSKYQHDEGASYLPLLNVIPEYHGKKVGKQLILTVLKDAIESEWSRFDLFTWSGNIKAMPLYKKCGFFWERKNDNVHLMNFLPYLYQTEALDIYLSQINSYNDNKRHIDMEPDGNTENGFDFYRYEFKNSDLELICDFEKTGRGLTYLDTPDYTIKMNINEHDLVYNSNYEVSFDITNKNETPLDIKIVGKNNKNINFQMSEEVQVSNSIRLTGQFHVGFIEKDQDTFRTHPVIEADIFINNKKATFKTGIEPKHPIKVKLFTDKYNHVINKSYTAYLDLENNLSTVEEFEIQLPKNFVEFEKSVKATLKPKEKRSIKVRYKLHDFGFYREEASVFYQDYEIKKLLYAPFKGSTSSFIGKSDYTYFMVSGNFITYVNTKSGNVALKSDARGDAINAFMPPKIGKPYSLEFSTQIPEVEIINDNELKLTYISNAFEGVKIVRYFKHIFGVLETYCEIINNLTEREISLAIPVWQRSMNAYVPFDGKLLLIDLDDEADIGKFDTDKIDENWIYNKKEHFGFAWDDELKLKVAEWRLSFDIENIKLNENQIYKTPSFYASIVHKNIKAFREFRGYLKEREELHYLEITINNGNPFVKKNEEVLVSVLNHKKATLKGLLQVDNKKVSINDSIGVSAGLKNIKLISKDKDISFKRQLFTVSGSISKSIVEDSHIVTNGLLTFKASKKYADSIYSLIFKDNEYLDSNYPKPKERSWWGDFVGGMTQRLNGVQDINALKEERNVDFVELKDNYNNKWEGIKITFNIIKDPDLKGLKIETYTMTLPNIPVVYSFANVTNNTGTFINEKEFYKFNVLKITNDRENITFDKNSITYKANDIGLEIDMDHFVQFNSPLEYDLAIYNPKSTLEVDTQINHNILFSHSYVTIPDQESKQIQGDFLIFTKEVLKEEYLSDLKNIKFEV